MPPPTFSDGDQLSAADVNDWMVPITAVKTSTTSRSSTTTPTDDPDLSVDITDSGLWMFIGFLEYNGPVGTHFKWTWNMGSTNGVINIGVTYHNTSNSLVHEFHIATDTHSAYTAGTADSDREAINITGFIAAGSASGTVTLQWSQNNSNGTATKLYNGSYLALFRLES